MQTIKQNIIKQQSSSFQLGVRWNEENWFNVIILGYIIRLTLRPAWTT